MTVESPEMFADQIIANPLHYTWHPEVWVLVGFLIGSYVYMVRVIGPKAVPPGTPVVSRMNKICFVLSMVTLFVASTWPVHDVGEEYLYSVHMLQHMMLSYFLPPLALMATPTWLARVLIGDGKFYRVVKWFSQPVVAAVLFNVVVMGIHIPSLVNASVTNGPLHYTLHVCVVVTGLLMWTPICGPIPEFRIGPAAAMIYLFLQSVIPTVPAAWLTFAEGAVYPVYNRPTRLFGVSLIEDQQLAGATMKIAGGMFLWGIVIYIFFKRFSRDQKSDYDFRRSTAPSGSDRPHDQFKDVSDDDILTTADVERAFAETVPPAVDR